MLQIRSWAIVYKMTDLKSLLEEVDEEYTEISVSYNQYKIHTAIIRIEIIRKF